MRFAPLRSASLRFASLRFAYLRSAWARLILFLTASFNTSRIVLATVSWMTAPVILCVIVAICRRLLRVPADVKIIS